MKFLERQITQIRQGGRAVLFRKMKRVLCIPHKLFLSILTAPVLMVIHLIRPWLLIRWGELSGPRIGHFAANTELYLCERYAGINLPGQRHVDIFFMEAPICNRQLARMWKRILHVWPAWIMLSLRRINRLIPGGAVHEVGETSCSDRDVHNLIDRFPPHLRFTAEEEVCGEAGLQAMGIPPGTPFVCLNVRDSAYLDAFHKEKDWSYHNYRDSDIQNFVPAAEELANRGYFVIRMGVKARKAVKTTHQRVIDYATNGMRSDFMDIYLGAKCEFCISVGSGFDAIPYVFRRPIVYVNIVPLGYLGTYGAQNLGITKYYFSKVLNKKLALREIFAHGVGFSLRSLDYISHGVELIQNTPEEIRDVSIEMAERLNGIWKPHEDDEALQKRFWEIFSTYAVDAYPGQPIHSEIRSRMGAAFLRNNRAWLQ